MTELFLVRHGETDWNRERRIQGRTDIPLNDTGREQALATGRLLARRRWDGIVTSPLVRAAETAAIIAAEVGLGVPEPIDALMERNYGQAEGLGFEEVDRRFPEGIHVPGRESREAVALRVVPALLRLAAERPGQAIIVVSHGGAIRSVLNSAEPEARHGRITNASVHSFRVVDGDMRLIAFDDPIELESTELALDADIDAQNAIERRDGEVH